MKLKVLILDDEFIIREGLCAFPWESYGCEVVGSAEDGEEGLRLAKTLHPDILLSDIKMPEMDGHHLTKLVKSDEEMKGIPLIIFSSLINSEMRIKGKQLGADEQLSKPEIGHLVEVMDTLLERR